MSHRCKIAVYLHPEALVNPTGIGMLAVNMPKALARNPDVELILMASASDLTIDGKLPAELGLGGIPVIPLPWKRSIRETLWLAFDYPSLDGYLTPDFWIYNAMETYMPARRCRRIVTVHHFDPPTVAPALSMQNLREKVYSYRLRKAITTADLVVAQSSFTGAQIRERYGVPPERLAVVGSGVEPELFAPAVKGEEEARMQIAGRFIISVGAFQPRKGSDYLIGMGRELLRRKSPLKIVCPFAVRGLPNLVEEARTLPNMVLLDYISRQDLIALMRAAVCMVIPSRLEGFGLTAIEAMALGTPVLASNSGALPETLGDAGVLVDPANAQALADEATRFMEEPAYREAHALKARRRARFYTWESCMHRLLDGIRAAPARK